MSVLIRYETACRALADAKAVDEVKDICDKAEAVRHYARQAKNRTLEIDAVEIRVRAERRLGEILCHARTEGTLARRGKQPVGQSRRMLKDVGITKKLSARAQRLAAVEANIFDARIGAWRKESLSDNGRVTPPTPGEPKITRIAKKSEPVLAVSSRDVGSWSVGEVRRIARALDRIVQHCGAASDFESVRDCVSDHALRTIGRAQ